MLERVLKPRELTPTELKAPRSLVLPSCKHYTQKPLVDQLIGFAYLFCSF